MRYSIVTPVYNDEKYIAETIESVLSQEGDFEIDYIIQDGGSVDGTLDIVRSYAGRVNAGEFPFRCKGATFRYFSEKDHGMYDALEKGFAKATGDVMAYINADDQYLPGAFASVATIFSQYPDIRWIKGINTTGDEHGVQITMGLCFLYRQDWLRKGIYGRHAYFVQQDSVFWRRSLWEEVRPGISQYRLAGDYALWILFAQCTPLWSFNKTVSMFRKRPGQLSEIMEPYRTEQEHIAPHHWFLEKRIASYFFLIHILGLHPISVGARMLHRLIFPFSTRQWYIDFNETGRPFKKEALSYTV